MQDKASKELAGRTQQNLGVMMQTGVKLAEGYQSIMREWADYTRNAMQCNIDGMNSIMRARTPQDLMAAQSELLNAEVRVMLNSGVKISEATLRVARDAAQSIGERTRQRVRSPDGSFQRMDDQGEALFLGPTRPDRPGIPVLLVRLDLDVVPHVTDPNAILQRAMTCLSTVGELTIGFAAGADCPVATVFLHQVFNMGYGAHGHYLRS